MLLLLRRRFRLLHGDESLGCAPVQLPVDCQIGMVQRIDKVTAGNSTLTITSHIDGRYPQGQSSSDWYARLGFFQVC